MNLSPDTGLLPYCVYTDTDRGITVYTKSPVWIFKSIKEEKFTSDHYLKDYFTLKETKEVMMMKLIKTVCLVLWALTVNSTANELKERALKLMTETPLIDG